MRTLCTHPGEGGKLHALFTYPQAVETENYSFLLPPARTARAPNVSILLPPARMIRARHARFFIQFAQSAEGGDDRPLLPPPQAGEGRGGGKIAPTGRHPYRTGT